MASKILFPEAQAQENAETIERLEQSLQLTEEIADVAESPAQPSIWRNRKVQALAAVALGAIAIGGLLLGAGGFGNAGATDGETPLKLFPCGSTI